MVTDCDLCHEDTPRLYWRGTLRLCEPCAAGLDGDAAMTPAERRADHEAADRYVDEGGEW